MGVGLVSQDRDQRLAEQLEHRRASGRTAGFEEAERVAILEAVVGHEDVGRSPPTGAQRRLQRARRKLDDIAFQRQLGDLLLHTGRLDRVDAQEVSRLRADVLLPENVYRRAAVALIDAYDLSRRRLLGEKRLLQPLG